MIREQLFKPFAVLVTKWKRNTFFAAHAKLTAAYAVTTAVLVGIFSYFLYVSLIGELQALIEDQVRDPDIQRIVLDRAAGILQMRILIADGIVLVIVVMIGYLLTKVTLRPIRQALDREHRFIADAAHELRTPLAVMKTEMEVALRDKESSEGPIKKVLRSAVEEIDNLTHIANGLIEIVRGQEKKPSMSNISIHELLDDTAEKLRPLAREKHIVLEEQLGTESPIVKGNRTALASALYNIVHNAITYTPEGGSVRVVLQGEGEKCKLIVSDTGIGVSQKDLLHIFEPFYRVDSSHTTTSGAGLGLAIVKAAVEGQGGSIKIESVVGKGTTVSIILPVV